jgi:transposase-like protein
MNDEQPPPNRRVTRRHSVADRERLLDEFKSSGLTQRAFAGRLGIHPATLSGWVRKAAQAPEGFAEVSLPLSAPAPIEVDLPNGVRIRVRTTGDVSRTAELIRAVAAPLKGGA